MYQHILVPLDGSELAECVLPHVRAVAEGCKVGKVTFIEVVEPFHIRGGLESRMSPEDRQQLEKHVMDHARDYLEQIAAQFRDSGVIVQTEVLYGHIVDSIIDYAAKNGIDLLVIATHGRSGVSRWVWGSVTDRILRSAHVPVMMVRAPGCVPGI